MVHSRFPRKPCRGRPLCGSVEYLSDARVGLAIDGGRWFAWRQRRPCCSAEPSGCCAATGPAAAAQELATVAPPATHRPQNPSNHSSPSTRSPRRPTARTASSGISDLNPSANRRHAMLVPAMHTHVSMSCSRPRGGESNSPVPAAVASSRPMSRPSSRLNAASTRTSDRKRSLWTTPISVVSAS